MRGENMKKTRLLNSRISEDIAKMGHFDTITIADAGLPINDKETDRIDIALSSGIPSFMDTLDVVLSELCVQKVYIAAEMKTKNSSLYEQINNKFKNVEIVEVPHEKFKELTNSSRAVIRTGETKPYANIILESGVVFNMRY